jgi:hypothetical protein
MPLYCREKFNNGTLVSRLCITDDRDLFMMQSEYPRPQFEIAQVSSCDSCSTYPSGGGSTTNDGMPNYVWKKATDPDDVANFVSGRPPYNKPVRNARITSALRDNNLEFYVFYEPE